MNELYFDQEGRDLLISGIEKISKTVKSTLGPNGKTVIIESDKKTRGLTVTKDGVKVAKSIDLEHPVENLAVNMVKEAAGRTAAFAGDGTTTAIVLTEAIVLEGMDILKNDTSLNVTDLVREINRIADQIISELTKRSKKVTGKTLSQVATISCNNDPKLGSLVSKVYNQVGKNGLVTVENSDTSQTYYEVTNGIKIDRGYSSRAFINNHKNDECVLDDVYILSTDLEINSILNIENVLKPIIQQGKKLLIIGECSQNVLNTLGLNVIQNGLKLCAIKPPQFGYKTKELMSDIALSVGAKYFSESTGDDLSLIGLSDLGFAKKVVISESKTVIVREESTSEEVQTRIEELKQARENSTVKRDRDFISERIASLSGGVGVIYAGGNSDVEQKELYDRIEDAICAVRSAIEEGILPGGGSALGFIAKNNLSHDILAERILFKACLSPLVTLCRNSDFSDDRIGHVYSRLSTSWENKDWGVGHNFKNNTFGDMYKMGIIDPAKVTKNALKNAVSVATTILTTNAIVTIKR